MRLFNNFFRKSLAVVLAGGQGSRLKTLTTNRAKPAVPFGGKYTILDFPMSNLENSGFRTIVVLPQFANFEIMLHLQRVWNSDPAHDFFVYPLYPQYIQHAKYQATADAVQQNMDLFERIGEFETIAILAGDHVYSMDYSQMLSYHYDVGSKFTVSVLEMPSELASGLGVLEVDEKMRIIGFVEKPSHPKEIPGKPGYSLVSMGNYITDRAFLKGVFPEIAEEVPKALDFGEHVIPYLIRKGADIFAYNFNENVVPGSDGSYWRDVGTVEAYWRAHMDVVEIDPSFNIHNTESWPIRTYSDNLPGAKLIDVHTGKKAACLASGGSILQRCLIESSVLGRRVKVFDKSEICCSILFDDVSVSDNCHINNTIIDKKTFVPSGTNIGIDLDADKARGLYVDKSGIVIVPSGFKF